MLLLEHNKKIFNKELLIKYLIITVSFFNYLSGLIVYSYDLIASFSDAEEASKFINNNTSKDSTFICTNTFDCTSIVPFTNRKFYNPKNKTYYTFNIENDFILKNMNAKEIIDIIYEDFSCDNVYLIVKTSDYIKGYDTLEKEGIINLIYNSNEDNFVDEMYQIYEIKGFNYNIKEGK